LISRSKRWSARPPWICRRNSTEKNGRTNRSLS
jgi:hypothetical protein